MTPIGKAQTTFDPKTLEPFIDGVMEFAMDREHIAGATVSLILGGEPALMKGYGYADLAERTPIDPHSTLFRIASITKTFTWLSIMQQRERGALDLDANVNDYLTHVQVPATYSDPITLRHLMTHTAGFEDKIVGIFSRRADDLIPLAELLSTDLPARVRRPGEFVAYSNHGAALAGHVLAEVSGMPWEAYIEKEFLGPLRMEHTTTRQPIPESLALHMSKGYIYRNGIFVEQPFQFVTTPPAGVMSSTAADMTKYMMMLLNHGQHRDGRVMSETTSREVSQTLFTPHPRVSGIAHGFAEHTYNGLRFIGHGGSTEVFQSYFLVNPEHGFGVFVANNSSNGSFELSIIRTVLNRLFPPPPSPTLHPSPEIADSTFEVTGTYLSLRREYTGPAKIGAILPMSTIQVTAEPDGAIQIRTPASEAPARYIETDPLVFREENGPEVVVFDRGEDDRVHYIYLGNEPYQAFERAAFYQTFAFHGWTLGAVLLVFGVTVVGWPIRAVINLRAGNTYGRGAATLRVYAWVVALLHLVFLVRLTMALSDPGEIAFGMTDVGRSALGMTIPLAIASASLPLLAAFAYAKRYWHTAGRFHFAIVTLAAIILVAWEHYWNLLGHRY